MLHGGAEQSRGVCTGQYSLAGWPLTRVDAGVEQERLAVCLALCVE